MLYYTQLLFTNKNGSTKQKKKIIYSQVPLICKLQLEVAFVTIHRVWNKLPLYFCLQLCQMLTDFSERELRFT